MYTSIHIGHWFKAAPGGILVPRHYCVCGQSWFQQPQVSLLAKMHVPAIGGQAGMHGHGEEIKEDVGGALTASPI